MRLFDVCIVLPLAAFLTCCGGGGGKPEMKGNAFGPTGIPPELRAKPDGSVVAAGGNVSAEAARALENYDPGQLVWTDPDNPDAPLPELDGLLAAPKKNKGPWLESEAEALRESKRTGKPLLIWFTDSLRSTSCKSLSAGLLTRSDFETWASEYTVRLVVDQNVTGGNIDTRDARQIYVRNLKKKYNARGYPSLHVLTPGGEVIGRYKSYRKGQEEFIWGQLKQAVSLANESQQAWRKSLEKKGYRDWSNDKGRTIFAKLAAYKDGELILVEPDGQRAKTHEKNLSAGDRVWIQQQKEMRGIH